MAGWRPARCMWSIRTRRRGSGARAFTSTPICPPDPAIVLVAVKPQMMGAALPTLRGYGNGATLFVSVAAGTTIATYEEMLGARTPVVRAMPNTPAAVGRGITAIIGNAHATPAHLDAAEALLRAVGQVVRLDSEDQMDAVTGLSGSGPAYVFHMIECLARAGEAQGLAPDLAMQLAQATVAGAGALAEAADETPAHLRENVTSPGGTTQAGLEVLMDEADRPAAAHGAHGPPPPTARGLARWLRSPSTISSGSISGSGASRAPKPSPRRAPPRSSSGSISARIWARRNRARRSPRITPRGADRAAGVGRCQLPAPADRQVPLGGAGAGAERREGEVVLIGPDSDVPEGGRLH